MNSSISATIVGHLISDPRTFSLRDGVGCDLRILITLRVYDASGIPTSRERRIKVVTYDTAMAERLVRDYKFRDFVEVQANDLTVEKAWEDREGTWRSGSPRFSLVSIRKVGPTTPEGDEPMDADQAAEAATLSGVTVS